MLLAFLTFRMYGFYWEWKWWGFTWRGWGACRGRPGCLGRCLAAPSPPGHKSQKNISSNITIFDSNCSVWLKIVWLEEANSLPTKLCFLEERTLLEYICISYLAWKIMTLSWKWPKYVVSWKQHILTMPGHKKSVRPKNKVVNCAADLLVKGRFASLIAINTDQICSIGGTPPSEKCGCTMKISFVPNFF